MRIFTPIRKCKKRLNLLEIRCGKEKRTVLTIGDHELNIEMDQALYNYIERNTIDEHQELYAVMLLLFQNG